MPKVIDHGAYRKELVEQAAQLFSRIGYAGLGMRDIATALTVSKSALYHYFPSKESLFAAVAEAAVQADLASFSHHIGGEDGLRGRLQALAAYCAGQEDRLTSQYLILMDYVRGKNADEVKRDEVLQKATGKYIEFTRQFLGLPDPHAAAGILAFHTGLLLLRLFDGRQTDYAQTAERFNELIISCLSVTAADRSGMLSAIAPAREGSAPPVLPPAGPPVNDTLVALGHWHLTAKAARERMYSAPTPRERERWHAIWLLAMGWPVAQVATALERDPHTIGDWAAAFKAHGPAGLSSEQRGDAPRPRSGAADAIEAGGAGSVGRDRD